MWGPWRTPSRSWTAYSSMLSVFYRPPYLLLHNRFLTKEPLQASIFFVPLIFDGGSDCLYHQIVMRKTRAWLKLPCNLLVLLFETILILHLPKRGVHILYTVIIMSGCVLHANVHDTVLYALDARKVCYIMCYFYMSILLYCTWHSCVYTVLIMIHM